MNPYEVFPTLERFILADGSRIVPDIGACRGSMMRDAVSGTDYLDMSTYFASLALSYDHPALNNEAFLSQAQKCAPYKLSNPDFYSEVYADFAQAFSRLVPEDMRRFFFIDTGALAVENALKAAFDWKARKNLACGRKNGADRIISFEYAFHGRSGYALSVTHSPDPRKTLYFPVFPWPVFEAPARAFPEQGDWEAQVDRVLAQIDLYCLTHPGDVAGMIVEPVQGEGGNRIFGERWFSGLRALADRHEFLLIFDEVQSGMALTGKLWAFEHYGVKPDILVFGKKTQVCGIAAGPRIDEVKENVLRVSSRISGTWCGNLLDFLRGSAIFKTIIQENLAQNARVQGARLLKGLTEIQARCPEMSQARGLGMMLAFDLPTAQARDRWVRDLQEKEHLLVLPCGTNALRLRPVLDVDERTIDEVLNRIDCVARERK